MDSLVPVAATGNHEGRGRGEKGEERMSERGRGKQGEEEIRFFRKGSDTDTKWLRMGKKRESW